jgi:flagellar protein FlaG
MKIDSMDAQNVYNKTNVQPVNNIPKTEEVVIQNREIAKTEGNRGDLNAELQDKHLSDMNDMDRDSLSLGEKTLIDAIEKANKVALGRNTSFRFSIHEATKRISVKVLDKDTNEVIREIPPEKVLDMVARLWEMAGIIVDERR